MAETTLFESRKGYIKGRKEDIYGFVSDIRNFERFIPKDRISNVVMSENSCSFSVQGIGNVGVFIQEKTPYSRIVFKGTALMSNEFRLIVDIFDSVGGETGIKVSVEAQLNPMLKMMLSEPLNKFLEILVTSIENFDGWK